MKKSQVNVIRPNTSAKPEVAPEVEKVEVVETVVETEVTGSEATQEENKQEEKQEYVKMTEAEKADLEAEFAKIAAEFQPTKKDAIIGIAMGLIFGGICISIIAGGISAFFGFSFLKTFAVIFGLNILVISYRFIKHKFQSRKAKANAEAAAQAFADFEPATQA